MTEPMTPPESDTPRTSAALLDAKLNFPNASFVHADFARQLERELAARKGYVLVPVEPTAEMIEALMGSPWIIECETRLEGNTAITINKEARHQRYIIDGWQAMLRAAPSATNEE